jgi:hypothetical protein
MHKCMSKGIPFTYRLCPGRIYSMECLVKSHVPVCRLTLVQNSGDYGGAKFRDAGGSSEFLHVPAQKPHKSSPRKITNVVF